MTGSSTFTLVLGGDVSVKAAGEVLTKFRSALEEHSTIALDTQTITHADVTTVQTLLAARNKAQSLGKSIYMSGPIGTPLKQVLDGAGFTHVSQPHAEFWTSNT